MSVAYVQVIGAGFTISPLQSQFRHGHPESHECLVTMVWNIDLGGFLSPNSYLAALFRPLAESMAWKFTGRIVQGLLCLRDYVRPLPLPCSCMQPSASICNPACGSHVGRYLSAC